MHLLVCCSLTLSRRCAYLAQSLSEVSEYYTPYEGLNLANQNNRKLEVFGRKLEETSQNCIDILINISENETILFN